MPFNVRSLVTKAFHLSGIVSKKLQTVAGDELSDGMDLLNLLLSEKGMDVSLIPYFKEYSFNAVAGQEEYFVPNLVFAETLTFNIDNIRYSLRPSQRKEYFGTSRTENIQSLPYRWRCERTLNGSNVYIYFLPSTNYPLKVWGKFGLDEVTSPDLDLLTIYDRFYIEYLRYGLAEIICAEYNITFLPESRNRLLKIEKKLSDISPSDLTINKRSTLQQRLVGGYGAVNLGRGWTP